MHLNQTPLAVLRRTSSLCFVLLILVLPWTIAPMSIAGVLSLGLTIAFWATSREPWAPGPVLPAAIAWLAALLISALFAEDRGSSLLRLGKGFLPLVVPMAAFHAVPAREGHRALAALLLSSAAASLFGMIFFVAEGASFAARARGPTGHYMTFGGQLLLLVSLAAGVAFLARAPRWRWGAALAGVLGLAALAATFTRSAWLGLAASLAVMLAVARPRRLPLLALLLAAVYLAAPPSYRDRLNSAFDPSHPTNRERTHMWSAGVRIFGDHPVTGVGLQDLKPIYQRYRDPDAREAAGHLHNTPLQIAVSTGVIGLAAFAWLYGALMWSAGRGLRAMLRAPGIAAGVRLGVLGGLSGFLVAGLFEWNFGDEELLWLLYALAGLAWAARRWEAAPGAATPAAAGAPAPPSGPPGPERGIPEGGRA